MPDNDRKPSLRFKGFNDTWEQCKLSQLYDFSKGRGLSLDTFYEGNDSLGIAYGHLYTKYTEVINKVTLSTHDDSGVLSRKGDLLFPGSSTVPFGTAQSNAIMLDNVRLGGDVIIARAKNLDIYAPFISYQINAQNSKLFPITVGTTITHMYGKDIANIEYKFPKYDEQVKIGSVLESIDKLITLHQRKYDKIVSVKKALLDKMFPQTGNDAPKIRFKGFTDTWEQRNIRELGKIFIGLVTTMTSNYTDKGTLLIRNSDIKENRFQFSDNPIFLESKFASDNSSRMLKIGDVVTVHTGDVGTSAVIGEKEENSIGFATINTRPKKDIINSNYLSCYFNTDIHKNFAVNMSTGDGRTNYNLKEFNQVMVPLPSVTEQQKVASLVLSVNNLITLHQRKCNL